MGKKADVERNEFMADRFFRSDGFVSSGFLNFIPKEAYEETKAGAVIVDVREEFLVDFKSFDVAKVMAIPYSQIEARYFELPTDIGLIIADSTGLKMKETLLFLQKKGFKNIAGLAGGFIEWERAGMPLLLHLPVTE